MKKQGHHAQEPRLPRRRNGAGHQAPRASTSSTNWPRRQRVRDKHKAALDEIIARVNQLFIGELYEGDKLLYVNDAIKGKLLGARR